MDYRIFVTDGDDAVWDQILILHERDIDTELARYTRMIRERYGVYVTKIIQLPTREGVLNGALD